MRKIHRWTALAVVLLIGATVVGAESVPPPRPARSVSGMLLPGDTLRLETLPGGGGVEFEILSAGSLGCRSEVPDIPARDWYAFGESIAWTRSVTRQLGPDRAKTVGVALWQLARCYTPPPEDRSCGPAAMPDWTGAEVRTWAGELLRRHPGLGWVGRPLLDGLTDAEVEDLYDRTRAFARGCADLADEK